MTAARCQPVRHAVRPDDQASAARVRRGPAKSIGTLTVARSVTARVFTRGEQAQNHAQAGNIALSVQVMLDWLDSMDRRDKRPGLMS